MPTTRGNAAQLEPVGEKSADLEGLRLLLVEDDFLVATWIVHLLERWGVEVVGPAPSVEAGLTMARHESIDGAILDINVRGGRSSAIADALRRRGAPFFFITGYASPGGLPERLRSWRMLYKPLSDVELRAAIVSEIGGKGGEGVRG